MTLTLLLYWFPIFLGVCVGTTLMGGLPRPRGAVLAAICALFWIALVQSHLNEPFWHGAGMLFSTLSGAGAIAVMGLCGPECRTASLDADSGPLRGAALKVGVQAAPSAASDPDFQRDAVAPVTASLKQFETWLEAHRNQDDPWTDFDELVRAMIYQWVGGTHVRTYRILDSGDHLVPLRENDSEGTLTPDGKGHPEIVSARKGVLGYVATTGRTFLAGDATQGALIEHLVHGDEQPPAGPEGRTAETPAPAWCFAVSRRAARIGLVAVGSLDARAGAMGGRPAATSRAGAFTLDRAQRELLRLAELLISHFWNSLIEVDRGRAAVTTDPGSGVLTRKAFFEFGGEDVREAYRAGEPLAVAILATEGVRALDDDGQWDAADDVRAMVSGMLKKRMRSEDRIGRFDDSRFVLLLRRVDSELAQLIMRELMAQLVGGLLGRKPYADRIELRCGLAGAGVRAAASHEAEPTLRALVGSAVGACCEARRASVAIASDLAPGRERMAESA